MTYEQFLAGKELTVPPAGPSCEPCDVNPILFPWQRQVVAWAVRKGRCGLFASTGLGKTFLQIEWSRLIGERTLILAPLAVASQTVKEAAKLGVPITYARCQEDARPSGITITNYEMLHRFTPERFGAVVLDEASILKHHEAKTRTRLIEAFRHTPYRLAATATPAPNDHEELTNHAHFLGVMTRQEMLSAFFLRDDRVGWRLRRHAEEPFYRWMASWAMSLTRPSEIGFSDEGYDLPKLTMVPHFIDTDYLPPERLFVDRLQGVRETAAVRRETAATRIHQAVSLILAEAEEPWLVWCGLNDEADGVTRLLPDAVNVEGSLSVDEKTARIERFLAGEARVMVSKPSVAGFGLNLQHCARMAFVGLGYSWEQYYQCIRRCWRFGQRREVVCHVILTEPERSIYEAVLAKEREAIRMTGALIRHVAEFERQELSAGKAHVDYQPERPMTVPGWLYGRVGSGSD